MDEPDSPYRAFDPMTLRGHRRIRLLGGGETVLDARALHGQLRGLTDERGAIDGKIAFDSAFERDKRPAEAAFGLPTGI
ncbi:MAG: hypothetical protein OXG35_24075 [Acidobacteria bacterium]|nr:hypothetical protein [Acidobacteriota bacterium]